MPVTFQLIPSPIGSQFICAIGNDDPDDLNDFSVFVVASENVTGLELSDFSFTIAVDGSSSWDLSDDVSLLSLEGENSVYTLTVRPPAKGDFPYQNNDRSAVITLILAANAVTQGNPRTTKTIRISDGFPDTDAENATSAFTSITGATGIAVTPSRILIHYNQTIHRFTHAGTEQVSERSQIPNVRGIGNARLDYINGQLLIKLYSEFGRLTFPNTYERIAGITAGNITHTRLGIVFLRRLSNPDESGLIAFPYGETEGVEYHFGAGIITGSSGAAHQDDLIYAMDAYTPEEMHILEVKDEGFSHINRINVSINPDRGDLAIYGDTLYSLGTYEVFSFNISKYRPMAKNTKTTIYPVFATAGSRINLKQFAPDAERITFDVGYNKPPFLSINNNNELVLSNSAETCEVFLKGINRIDATEDGTFHFYLVIESETPSWRGTGFDLTMRAGSTYDLWALTEKTDSIAFKSGGARPSGSSLSDGVFTIGTVGGRVDFTARRGSRTADMTMYIDVLQDTATYQNTDVFRYRVEIAGRDVTSDLIEFPAVSESLDPILINEYRVNESTVLLENANGTYSGDVSGNFWATHGLHSGGFREPIKIFIDHYDTQTETWVADLLFNGVILQSSDKHADASFEIVAVDSSFTLRNTTIAAFGTTEKVDRLRKQSDEDSYEGVYVPERSLLPMQTTGGEARSHRTDIDISRLALPSEGPAPENTGHLTESTFHTAGGFLENNPLLRFKTALRSEDVRYLINQLAINKKVYNTEIDLPEVELDTPFLLNRGSIAFSVEKTRTTRTPVDWAYDSTNERLLILLSNPESHINDLLVAYDLERDTHRVLHTFSKSIKVHRIARRDATHYYILTSGAIQQDRSAAQSPRQTDKTAFAYDSLAQGSNVRIHHYNANTGALTQHVGRNNARNPQLAVHYYVGFENDVYVDEFEGVRPEYRGAFKWVGNYLYYRYAKDGEFGVARVNASGTTERLLHETSLGTWNHCNFAFDVHTNGDVYFAYAVPASGTSTLLIKRRASNGTITTLLQTTGEYLGVLETLFHNNQLYLLVPIRRFPQITDLIRPTIRVTIADTGITPKINVSQVGLSRTDGSITPYRTGENIRILINWSASGTVQGLSENDFTITNATFVSLTHPGGSYQFYLTVRPTHRSSHRNIIIDIAENAVNRNNEATRIVIDFGASPTRTKSAGMALYRCNVSGSPRLTVLETWDYVARSAQNLHVHQNQVYFTEGIHPQFKPINEDLEGWNDRGGYNSIEEPLGKLKRIETDGTITDLGNVWHDNDRPYNNQMTPLLSVGSDLHLCAGYGDKDAVLRYNSLASGADTAAHIVLGNRLKYVIPRFASPSGAVYQALADLAKNTNATLSFEKNIIRVIDRQPHRAETNGVTGTGTGNLRFRNANKPFQNSGYLQIGTEVLRFTGISGRAFTGVTRGVLETTAHNHANGVSIHYLNGVISEDRILALHRTPDINNIYNIIRSGTVSELRDNASIALYDEIAYTLDLSHLTRHEKAWIDSVLENYLQSLKDLKDIVSLEVKVDFGQKLGHIIAVRFAGTLTRMRIVGIDYTHTRTRIVGRTL